MVFKPLKFLNRSTTQIQAQFTSDITPGVSISNVRVASETPNIPDLTVRGVYVDGDVISVHTNEQIPFALYYVEFFSTEDQVFSSLNGESLQETGINRINFVGLENANTVRDDLFDATPPVYNVESDTYVRKHLSNVADQIMRARNAIREAGTSNYVSVEVEDEIRTRGFSPTDRLANEGAYQVIRVGTTPTGETTEAIVDFNAARGTALLGANTAHASTQIKSFPGDPVSLRSVYVVNERVSNTTNDANGFDRTIITLANSNVIQINSVKLNHPSGDQEVYQLNNYGYSILDNRHDTVNGNRLLTLESNQFKLSDTPIYSGDFSIPGGSDTIDVSYTYIDNGINVNEGAVAITQVRERIRETIGAYLVTFYLTGFPIVTSNDAIPTSDGVSFLDPNPPSGLPFTQAHPAFASEIPYSETRLPAKAGEFSVDYATGQVFVFGASSADGTGQFPPVASYYYRKTFIEGIDYNLDSDQDEVAANATRNLVGEEVRLTYDYEQVLAVNDDYLAEVHNEVIDERVENRLVSTFRIATQNAPITNVFRLFNETTGEIYGVTRFSDNYITFSGRNAPRQLQAFNENVTFERVFNEPLLVEEQIENTGSYKVVKLNLLNAGILANTTNRIGANFNSSISFTTDDVFLSEYFYDGVLQTVTQNLTKLTSNGDYLVDHDDGVIYLRTASTTNDFGEINYSHASIDTRHSNILSPDSIVYRQTTNSDVLVDVTVDSFTSENILVSGLRPAGERFAHDESDKPILFGSKLNGVAGQRTLNSNRFVALDGRFSSSHADGNHILRFPDDADRAIIGWVSLTEVIVDLPFTDNNKRVTWCLIDFDLTDGDGYNAAVTYPILSVRGVYSVTSLQTVDRDSLVNLFDPELDTFDDNVITFNSTAIQALAPGTALAIDYSIGNLYADYTYVADNLLVSYEWGDNSLNHSINNTLNHGEEYYVSYKYGALRDSLLMNFGSLTQIEELVDFPLDFNREIYRGAIAGALQAFAKGPTKEALSTMVSEITGVEPNITELSFNEWTAGRDTLYLDSGALVGSETYQDGRFNQGLLVNGTTTLKYPAEAYISLREGTFESWVLPQWRGLDNDATLTFDLGEDGYTAAAPSQDGYGLQTGDLLSLHDIYIGSTGFNPTTAPFTLHREDVDPYSPVGRPANFGAAPGYYIWYDSDRNEWFLRAVGNPDVSVNFQGTITTTGEFYNVRDGYNYGTSLFIGEAGDTITSTRTTIDFDSTINGSDSVGTDGYVSVVDGYQLYQDGINFLSDDLHYLFDTGPSETHNRMSLYKDGSGYLNFRVYDDSGINVLGASRFFSLSHNIQDWLAGERHHVATAWRLNSAEGIDEMHLFVDGQEVANHFKFGGRPIANDNVDLFRTVATELLTSSVSKNIVGGFDLSTESGSSTVISAGSDFVTAGIAPGDTFTVLDPTSDSLVARTVSLVVDANTLVLDTAMFLTLENVSFAVNQLTFTTQTPLSIEKFTVFRTDTDGYVTELDGLAAETPDYTISKSGLDNRIHLNNNVFVGDEVSLNTLGLTRGRCRDMVYSYDTDNILSTNLEPPTDLTDVQIFKVLAKRSSIELDGYLDAVDGYGTWQADGYELDGYFLDLCQPSNQIAGKRIKVTLGGYNNIDFGGVNQVSVRGMTFTGATEEILSFSDYGSMVTAEYFTELDHIQATFTSLDPSLSFGSLEIIENTSMTISENDGDYVQVGAYDNGQFQLFVFGSGGTTYDLDRCWYLLDYPTRLNIPVSRKGDLYLGSDINGANQWDGVLDDVVFLNEMLADVRAGEIPASNERTVTEDYNSPREAAMTPQTMMLLNFNGNLSNIDTYYTTYSEEYLTNSRSVNAEFGDCAVFFDDTPLIIDNGPVVLDNDIGSIEFWTSPYIDIHNDMNHVRYYLDMSAATIEEVDSITAVTVQISRRAKEIVSVRLLSDDGSGTNYFSGGKLALDGQTITLGTRLPGQTTRVKVQYKSLDVTGDRLSIYKDGYGHLNFELQATESVYKISYPISWKRNTWHRVMVTWDLNNLDGEDRIRLFVDGVEGGTITYGTPGLLYGIGIVYGSAPVGSLGARFLTTNIDFTDTIGDIVVGNSFDRANPGRVRMDNLRFSNIVRQPATVAGTPIDLNFNANREAVLPVIEDGPTTAIYDFDREIQETKYLSNLYREETPLFNFELEVVDSFNRITDNQRAQDLISSLIGRIKPAHTGAFVSFV